ncbi:MAG: hypothetical protein KAS12_02910 [Candidatus Aenigmarchaeota archaeon]|nr:hypothetical protein [Candidatus Aenigmarchaeota archaeon]
MKREKYSFSSNNRLAKAIHQLLSKIAQSLENSPKIFFNKKIIQQINQSVIQLIKKTTNLGLNKSVSRNKKQTEGIVQEVDKLNFRLATIADMKLLPQKITQSLIGQCRQIIKFLTNKK